MPKLFIPRMVSLFDTRAGARAARWIPLLPAAILILALTLGFAQPLASDTSVYLLQTRTLLEQGNRYADSHDNKGPMMVGLSAPAVRLFGANAAADGRTRPYALHSAALATALPYSAVLG